MCVTGFVVLISEATRALNSLVTIKIHFLILPGSTKTVTYVAIKIRAKMMFPREGRLSKSLFTYIC